MKRAALLLFVLGVSCWAGILPVSDQLTVFEPNKSVLYQLTVFEDGSFSGTGSTCVNLTLASGCSSNKGSNLYYIDESGIADPWKSASYTTLWKNNPSYIVDVVGLILYTAPGVSPGDAYLGFVSNDDGSLPFHAATYSFPNTGSPIDVSYLLLPSLQTSGYTATFRSEFYSDIPEPSALALLCAGLASMIAGRRRG